MRRQLITVFVAISVMVAVAFVIPLGFLVRSTAEDRAIDAARADAAAIVPALVSGSTREQIESAVGATPSGRAGRLTVMTSTGWTIGPEVEVSERLDAALSPRCVGNRTGRGRCRGGHGRGQWASGSSRPFGSESQTTICGVASGRRGRLWPPWRWYWLGCRCSWRTGWLVPLFGRPNSWLRRPIGWATAICRPASTPTGPRNWWSCRRRSTVWAHKCRRCWPANANWWPSCHIVCGHLSPSCGCGSIKFAMMHWPRSCEATSPTSPTW